MSDWGHILIEDVKEHLKTKSIQEIADIYGISKWSMYKFTSLNKIDVWACKGSKTGDRKDQSKTTKAKPIIKVYCHEKYGELNKDNLIKLAEQFSAKEISELYGISYWALHKRAQKMKVSLVCRKHKETNNKQKLCCARCGKLVYKLENNLCSSCNSLIKGVLNDNYLDDSEFCNKIKELRRQYLSFEEIAKILHCNKSTVSYYCRLETRIKSSIKSRRYKKTDIGKFVQRLDSFKHHRQPGQKVHMCKDWNKKFRTSVSGFKNRNRHYFKNNTVVTETYSYKDALNYLGGTQLKCYLTGEPINIFEDDYQLDHIIPVSKGGDDSLQNMGITVPAANQMKRDFTLDELFYWCQRILEYNGYKVEKIEQTKEQ